jgi:ABC-type glycerol-3-phosphate transport system substrate-binding protein
MLRNILLGVGVFATLFAVLIFSGKLPIGKDASTKITGEVVIWGTVPFLTMNQILQSYNAQAKSYRISYKEFREEELSPSLVEALANGTGPDMILAQDATILSQVSRLYPFPLSSLSEKRFRDTYVDGATVFLSPLGALALPITVDPMVLFYNRRLLSLKGVVNPPQYWDEVAKVSPLLTETNARGQFVQSGIALGGATTPYAKDILMTIVRQLGQAPTLKDYSQDGRLSVSVTAETPVSQTDQIRPLSTALRYFVEFSDSLKTTYSWNDFSGPADEAFVAEKLAMYLGYFSEFSSLQARNPKASFDFTYFPQTKGYNTFTTATRYYGIATLKTSKNLSAALTVQATFAGSGVAPALAGLIGAAPALRSATTNTSISEVVARSMLVGGTWFDVFPLQSTTFVQSMISDVINNRRGPADSAALFVSRLQALYTPK